MNDNQFFNSKIPPSLNIYPEGCEAILELEDEEVGRVIKAIISYYRTGELPAETELTRFEKMAFSVCKRGVDYSARTWRERCEKNKENAQRRWNKD